MKGDLGLCPAVVLAIYYMSSEGSGFPSPSSNWQSRATVTGMSEEALLLGQT